MPQHRRIRALMLPLALVGVLAFGCGASTTPGNPVPSGLVSSPSSPSSSVAEPDGQLPTERVVVARGDVRGFGGATIYLPVRAGKSGAVAVSPGRHSLKAHMDWLGPRLAAYGFVVMIIDTITLEDLPTVRGDELLAALDYLTTESTVRDRVDPARLAVLGHSYGGGAALAAAAKRPTLRAAIPVEPYNDQRRDWSAVQVPTMVLGGEWDNVAPVNRFAGPFYASLPATLAKAFLVMRGADHFGSVRTHDTIIKASAAWLRHFLDGDTRYDHLFCPPPQPDAAVIRYEATCPA